MNAADYPPPHRRPSSLPADVEAAAVLRARRAKQTLKPPAVGEGTRVAGFITLAAGASLAYLVFEFAGREKTVEPYRLWDVAALGTGAFWAVLGVTLAAAVGLAVACVARPGRPFAGDGTLVVTATPEGIELRHGPGLTTLTSWASVGDWSADDGLLSVELLEPPMTIGLPRAAVGERAFVAWWDVLATHATPVVSVATTGDVA